MNKKIVAIGNDHAGTDLKRRLIAKFKDQFDFVDCGTDADDSVDYPDYSKKVCDLILAKKADWGILICGTGLGMCYSANRYKGIRAALCYNSLVSSLARRHNNANIICLGSRMMGIDLVFDCVNVFAETDFEGGRHLRRVEKMDK